jgi:hypothetical protein
MGVQSNTASAVVNKFPDLGGANGFTNGDEEAGVDPTQLDEGYFNAVTEEINAVINDIGGLTPLFDVASRRQLRDAILRLMYDQLGSNYVGDTLWSTRTFPASTATTAEKDWRNWSRDGFAKNVLDNANYDLTALVIPDDSQAIVEYTITVVQTTAINNYYLAKRLVSFKKSGGAVTVQAATTIWSDGALGITGGGLAGGGGSIVYQVQIPASPGSRYNLHVSARAVNVTTSIAT